MSEQPDNAKPPRPAVFDTPVEVPLPMETTAKMVPVTEEESIPVEQLIKAARELTQRITNDDRQRVVKELKDTGHQLNIRTKAPVELMEFFTGEIDLDTELAKRYAHAPLLSQGSFRPSKPGPDIKRKAVAILTSQDDSAMVTVDMFLETQALEITFTLGSMVSMRFMVGAIETGERQRWLELMRRSSGIAFLWTKQRWEEDYLIFVVRENFARIYAFSPKRFEAAVRLTPDIVAKLVDWLEAFWFYEKQLAKRAEAPTLLRPPSSPPSPNPDTQPILAVADETPKPEPNGPAPTPLADVPAPSENDTTDSEPFPFEW
ncbi:MAG: hypothetical protein BroJett018_18320 [Chloroflexota bacterium]|nr:hypothetical protein [Chloroflexota bacterium]NOG63927.1 hypothetical protein [Chloroflexota bacterium]GIK64038.1 MAG: hypothetical protein BroJett018_18320 [Chloroflexota bacterium]